MHHGISFLCGMSRNRLHQLEKVKLTKAAAKGKALGIAEDGRVVFVTNAVPGDVVDITARLKKRKFYEGKATQFHEYSESRVEPKCKHFGVCGGCKWQFMSYEAQLNHKKTEVMDNLERIGKIDLPEPMDIVAAPDIYYYRNKMEFSFSEERWLSDEEVRSDEDFRSQPALGFHAPGRWDKSIDLKECHLQADPSNAIRLKAKELALEQDLSFFNPRKQEGFLRTLMLRNSSLGDWMVLVQFFYRDQEKIDAYLQGLQDAFPEITSLLYTVNPKQNDTMHDLDVELFAGKDHIMEEMEGLKFKVGPKSFYQTNSKQALKLYEVTRDFCKLTGSETVYDLYTGTGTIAQFVAKQAKTVVGIEYVDAAIDDAKLNAKANGIDHAHFYAGDMKKVFNEDLISKHGQPDLVICDPPRDGMHKDVVEMLLKIASPRIVYVSCNVASQARDLAILGEMYEVEAIQPVDMFPQTHHVENVVSLVLKG